MYYPWVKKHTIRKLLSLTMVLTLICALFAGCGLLSSNKETTEPDVGPNILDTKPTFPTSEPTDPPTSEPTPSGSSDKSNIAIVKETVNIRSGPNENGNVVGTLEAGEEVEVISTFVLREVEWVNLRKGWVPASSLDMSNVDLDSAPGTPDATDPPATTATEPPAPSGNDNKPTGTETGSGNAVVIASELNIRKEPTTEGDNKVGSYAYGDRITINETQDGWGKTSKGWVSLKYVYRDGDVGSNGCSGTVTATQLNKRAGPGKNYEKTGSLNNGASVKVLQRVTVKGEEWGYVEGGWISMKYVDTGSSNSDNGGGTTTATGNGTITAEGGLHIRSGPGTDYDSVGGLKKGDRVNIIETKDGWGRIAEGWISMNYVDMD